MITLDKMPKVLELNFDKKALAGNVGNCCDCPVVRAVKRHLPRGTYVSCGISNVCIGAGRIVVNYAVPKILQKMQDRLFNDKEVKPFTYRMKLRPKTNP